MPGLNKSSKEITLDLRSKVIGVFVNKWCFTVVNNNNLLWYNWSPRTLAGTSQSSLAARVPDGHYQSPAIVTQELATVFSSRLLHL